MVKTGSIHVLHVLAPARQGGLERVVAMLAEGQRPRSHVAAVLAPEDTESHPFVSALRDAHVPVTQIVVGGRQYVREYSALRDTAVRTRPDIIHTHGYRADVIGALAARALRIPVVSTVHGFTGGSWRNRINEAMQVVALRYARAVVAVSRPLVAKLKNSGIHAERISLLPNGFAPTGETLARNAARRALGLDSDAKIIGWVGRLSHEKGADVMLTAFAGFDAGWQLSIVGEGRETPALQALARELGIESRVNWHGGVNNAGELMTAFDAFVLSSRTEGTPIALLEAMHARVPIIATAVGGVPDVVSGEEAMLAPSEKPELIAAALRELVNNPDAAASRAESAYRRLVAKFSAANWLESMDGVYRRVVS